MAKWWIGAVYSLLFGSFLIGMWGGINRDDRDWVIGLGCTLVLIGFLLLWTAYRNEVEQAYDRGFERGKKEQDEDEEEEEEEGDDDPL